MLDVVAGSAAEKSLVKSIGEFFIIKDMSVRVTPIEVLEWGEEECLVDDISCTAQPPIETSQISGVLGKDIALSSTTRDPDNVWVTYWLSTRRGVSAVVFYDEYPSVGKRRIVVNEVPSYSFGTKMAARRPAVHVPLAALPRLRKMRDVDIFTKTFRRLSQGYVLDIVTGSKEPRVAIVTHHDRWLTGFRDNAVGILTMFKLARLLEKMKVSARLISFTAEEFGDPGENSFYWAYGSRAYARHLVDGLDLDLAIVVDTAHLEPIGLDYVGVHGLESKLSFIKVFRHGVGLGYTDAASLIRYGIPSAVVHNLDSIKPVYHTDVDRYPGRSVEAVITKLAKSLTYMIKEYENGDFSQIYRAFVEQVRKSSTPDMRRYLELYSNPIDASKCLTRHYTTLAIEGTYSDLNTEIKLLTYSDILRSIEAGHRYTILEGDIEVGPECLDQLKKSAQHLLEESVRCLKK